MLHINNLIVFIPRFTGTFNQHGRSRGATYIHHILYVRYVIKTVFVWYYIFTVSVLHLEGICIVFCIIYALYICTVSVLYMYCMLRAIPDSDIGVGTNCVIYNYTLISKSRHTKHIGLHVFINVC